MHKRLLIFPLLLTLFLLLAACQPPPAPTVAPPEAPTPTAVLEPTAAPPPAVTEKVVISEVLGGIKGNNNYEFIELYNPGSAPLDLDGWSLAYRLGTSEEDIPVYQWRGKTLLPGQGHYLLARAGQDVGVTPDAAFEQALNTFNGGLALYKPDGEIADRLGWGKAPEAFTEGTAAEAMANGVSLERNPGGEAGNAADSDDNAADFTLQEAPHPQNSGSPLTPAVAQRLTIAVAAPEQAEPGSQFEYSLLVGNETGQDVHDVVVEFLLPAGLTIGDLPANVSASDQDTILWTLETLADGDEATISIPVTLPWTYMTAVAHSANIQAADWPDVAVAGPAITAIAGGVIPVATARDLQGAELTVEGVATMYTGGYYAGGGNTKFYLQDDTGGMQVQVFGGEDVVDIKIGDRVRVHGEIGVYRGARQIVPILVPDDVEILAKATPDTIPAPQPVSIADAATDKETLPGDLVQVEGLVSRVEEFSYSYEIDLNDDDGVTLGLYVDKLTNIGVEIIETGKLYRAKGILELRDGKLQLYPRLQSDLQEVFPPILLITADAPNTVQPGQTLSYAATIFNHTAAPMTNIRVEATLPAEGVTVESISEGGVQEGDAIVWTLPELPGDGAQVSVTYTATVSELAEGAILSDGFSATADQWPEAAESGELITFVGDTVPIWAIQGPGASSPYVLDRLSVKGVITGVFPDLDGLFIQETDTDDDPNTSAGLFVNLSQVAGQPA
ncbi:MAG TPA: hypothetical protein G4N94_07710, partial [Caldilineae bacterium]|nr:hypothetical protein [Caldilineae bacterium]